MLILELTEAYRNWQATVRSDYMLPLFTEDGINMDRSRYVMRLLYASARSLKRRHERMNSTE